MPTYKCTGCEIGACTVTIPLESRKPAEFIQNFVCPVFGKETECANMELENAEEFGLWPDGSEIDKEKDTGRTEFLNNSQVINRLDLWIRVAKFYVADFEASVKERVKKAFNGAAWLYSLNDNAANEVGASYTTVHMWIYGDMYYGNVRNLLNDFTSNYKIHDINGAGYMCFWPEYYDDDDPDVIPDDDREPVQVKMIDISTDEILENRIILHFNKLNYSVFEFVKNGYTDYNDAQTAADALSGVMLDMTIPAPIRGRVQLTSKSH